MLLGEKATRSKLAIERRRGGRLAPSAARVADNNCRARAKLAFVQLREAARKGRHDVGLVYWGRNQGKMLGCGSLEEDEYLRPTPPLCASIDV